MINQQSKPSCKFNIDNTIQPLSIKMQRLSLFISLSDQDLPAIPLIQDNIINQQTLQQFPTATRMYFNDGDNQLLIYKNPLTKQNYLSTEQFSTIIINVLTKMLQKKKSYQEINFIDVLQQWLINDVLVYMEYDIYDKLVKDNIQEYIQTIQKVISVNVSKQLKLKLKQNKLSLKQQLQSQLLQSQLKQKQSQQKLKQSQSQNTLNYNNKNIIINPLKTNKKHLKIQTTILPSPKSSLITPSQQQQQQQQPSTTIENFTYFLQKFYIHYAKKSPNTHLTQQFQKLQQFYNTINLTKFMLYCKQVGLLKLDKKVTINYIKKLFVNNQDQRKVIQFQAFVQIVTKILSKIFKTEQQLKTKGYQTIGVRDRKNFVQTMAKIGVLVPLKKIMFTKPQNNNNININNKREQNKKIDLKLLQKMKSIQKKQLSQSQSQSKVIKQIKRSKQNSPTNNNNNNKMYQQQQQSSNTLLQQLINGGYPNHLEPQKKSKQNTLAKTSSLVTLPTIHNLHHQQPQQQQSPKQLQQDKMLQQLLQLDIQNDNDPYLQRFADQQKKYQRQLQTQKQRQYNKYHHNHQVSNVSNSNSNRDKQQQYIKNNMLQRDNSNNIYMEKDQVIGVMQRMDRRMNNVVKKVR